MLQGGAGSQHSGCLAGRRAPHRGGGSWLRYLEDVGLWWTTQTSVPDSPLHTTCVLLPRRVQNFLRRFHETFLNNESNRKKAPNSFTKENTGHLWTQIKLVNASSCDDSIMFEALRCTATPAGLLDSRLCLATKTRSSTNSSTLGWCSELSTKWITAGMDGKSGGRIVTRASHRVTVVAASTFLGETPRRVRWRGVGSRAAPWPPKASVHPHSLITCFCFIVSSN